VSGNITGANIIATNYNIRSVGTGISAAGSSQGTGTALTKTIPVNFETFRLINFNKCSDIEFAINVGFGVIKIVLNKDKTKLTYIVSALIN
jgi:hypothetical protein